MNKILVISLMFLLGIGLVYAADSPYCTYTTSISDSANYLLVTNNTINNISLTGDQKFSSLKEVYLKANFSLVDYSQNSTLSKQTGSTNLEYFRTANLVVYNATSRVTPAALGAGNYSLNTTSGTIKWTLDAVALAAGWNNTLVELTYNVSFVKDVDNLATLTHPGGATLLTLTAGADYGDVSTFRISDKNLNNLNYSVKWQYEERECSTRDACKNTQYVIFAAFGLMALFSIVGAAFLLINLAGGQSDFSSMMPLILGLVGLAITLIVGLVVIANVGASVCLV